MPNLNVRLRIDRDGCPHSAPKFPFLWRSDGVNRCDRVVYLRTRDHDVLIMPHGSVSQGNISPIVTSDDAAWERRLRPEEIVMLSNKE